LYLNISFFPKRSFLKYRDEHPADSFRRLFLHTVYRVPRTCGYRACSVLVVHTRAELGGAVRNEFPLLIIETIKTPAARTMAVRGRVGVRTTGATVVVLIFADWRVANVVDNDDDDDDGTLWQKAKGLRGVRSTRITVITIYYDYYRHRQSLISKLTLSLIACTLSLYGRLKVVLKLREHFFFLILITQIGRRENMSHKIYISVSYFNWYFF